MPTPLELMRRTRQMDPETRRELMKISLEARDKVYTIMKRRLVITETDTTAQQNLWEVLEKIRLSRSLTDRQKEGMMKRLDFYQKNGAFDAQTSQRVDAEVEKAFDEAQTYLMNKAFKTGRLKLPKK